MSKILIDRSTVEQALEALEGVVEYDYHGNPLTETDAACNDAINALLSALAEPQEPDSPERRCGGPGCDGTCCQPVQEPVAWLRVIDEAMVTHHLGVADPADDYETAKRKMNNLLCMAQDIGTYFAKQAEPVQEPAQKTEMRRCPRCWEPMFPPQRKPLTWAERRALWRDSTFRGNGGQMDWFIEGTRAAERAHGIGVQP